MKCFRETHNRQECRSHRKKNQIRNILLLKSGSFVVPVMLANLPLLQFKLNPFLIVVNPYCLSLDSSSQQ